MRMKNKKTVNDILNYELKDDSTDYGGIAFIGETVADFIEDRHYNSIAELNIDLVACGILPINEDEV